MSETPLARLDLDEQVARIERMQIETRKFVAESNKLGAEMLKLQAKGAKFQRERTTLLMTAGAAIGAAILGAGGVIGGLLVKLLQ